MSSNHGRGRSRSAGQKHGARGQRQGGYSKGASKGSGQFPKPPPFPHKGGSKGSGKNVPSDITRAVLQQRMPEAAPSKSAPSRPAIKNNRVEGKGEGKGDFANEGGDQEGEEEIEMVAHEEDLVHLCISHSFIHHPMLPLYGGNYRHAMAFTETHVISIVICIQEYSLPMQAHHLPEVLENLQGALQGLNIMSDLFSDAVISVATTMVYFKAIYSCTCAHAYAQSVTVESYSKYHCLCVRLFVRLFVCVCAFVCLCYSNDMLCVCLFVCVCVQCSCLHACYFQAMQEHVEDIMIQNEQREDTD